MKKILLTVLSLAILVGAILVPISASAATKEDVLNEFKKTPVNHWVYDDMVQLANNNPLTSEQYDKLVEYCKEFVAIFPEDKGPTYHDYTPLQQDKMLRLLDKVCEVLNLTYKIKPVEAPKHVHDDIIYIYNAEGKLIYEYDGDAIRKTDIVESNGYALYAIISASILAVAIVAFVLVSKKRKANKLAA